jgi:hypothetical protein
MSLLVALATCGAWSVGAPVYFLAVLPANQRDMSITHLGLAGLASAAVALLWAAFARRVARSCLQGSTVNRDAWAAAAVGFATFVALAGHFLWEIHGEWQAYLERLG